MKKYRTLLPKPTNPFTPVAPIRFPSSFQSSTNPPPDTPIRVPTPFQAAASSQPIASQTEYFRRERCGIDNCKTRLYYEENGLTFCKNGHHQQGEIATQQDGDDLIGKQTTTRVKTQKRKKGTRTASGRKAFELFVLCYQLVLRKQCWSLIHGKGFPEELEGIVRDLWALRLPLIKRQPAELVEDDEESQPESQTLFSSQEESGDESVDERERREKGLPTLVDTLSLCYMGAMLLRLPFSIGDLYRWAVKEEVPYVLPLRHVPQQMRAQLPTRYLKPLTMRSPLRPDRLHKAIYQLIALYKRHYDLEIPPLNFRPVLYKYIYQLALPLDTYMGVLHLADQLDQKFAFHPIRFRQSCSALPEIQLASLLVFVAKLYYPFDSTDRSVRAQEDLGYLTIAWSNWTKAYKSHMHKLRDGKSFEPGTEINVTEHDALDMSDEAIDQYVDWYEKSWVDLERRDTDTSHPISQDLLDMFPTGREDAPAPLNPEDKEGLEDEELMAVHEKVVQSQESLLARAVVTEEEEDSRSEPVRQIGWNYKRYRREEDLLDKAKVFYEAVAKLAGISVGTLVMAVFKIERKIMDLKKPGLDDEDAEVEDEMRTMGLGVEDSRL